VRRLATGFTGFTTRASCLLAAGVTALICGMVLGVTDLVRAGCFAIAVPVVAAIVVHRARVTIASRRNADPVRASLGSQVVIHLTVTNRSMLPSGALMLEDRLPDQLTGRARFVLDGLAGRESRTVAYTMPALPRGRYRAGPLRMRVVDPFGLIDITRSFTATSEFLVTPIVDRLPTLTPPVSFDAGENAGSHSIGIHGADDASTREYRLGDDLRKIHWRSTARTGALMVRHEERPWQGQTTLVLDVRANAHVSMPATATSAEAARESSSLEWAISAAASIGSHLVLAGRELALVDDLAHPQRRHYPSSAVLVDHLTDITAGSQADLTGLDGHLRLAARDSTVIAVLGRLDRASLRMLADAHPRGSAIPAFAILLDTATWVEGGLAGTAEWRQTLSTLRAAGWWAVPARRGDAIADVWTALLTQRPTTRAAREALASSP
jgi:uncharacterized protein (DUF58 family)